MVNDGCATFLSRTSMNTCQGFKWCSSKFYSYPCSLWLHYVQGYHSSILLALALPLVLVDQLLVLLDLPDLLDLGHHTDLGAQHILDLQGFQG